MFENLVRSATFPVVHEILDAVAHQLDAIKMRLDEVAADDSDDLAQLAARQQLKVLACWKPSIDHLVKAMVQTHKDVHGKPPATGRVHTHNFAEKGG